MWGTNNAGADGRVAFTSAKTLQRTGVALVAMETIHRAMRWLYTPTHAEPVSVDIPVPMLQEIRALQMQPVETVGHIDIDENGTVSRVLADTSQTIPAVSRDFEISYHTHPPVEAFFGNIPSRQDIMHILTTIGLTNEVHNHIIFCPNFIYVIGLQPHLRRTLYRQKVNTMLRTANATFKELSAQFSPSSERFRVLWIQALCDIGLDIRVQGTPGTASAYDVPLRLKLVPREPSMLRGLSATLVTIGAVATAVMIVKGRAQPRPAMMPRA